LGVLQITDPRELPLFAHFAGGGGQQLPGRDGAGSVARALRDSIAAAGASLAVSSSKA